MTEGAGGPLVRRGDVFTLYAEIYALRLSLEEPALGEEGGLGSTPCDIELSEPAAAPSPL